MYDADPFELFVEEKKLRSARRERLYAMWCAAAMVLLALGAVWGCL